MSYIGQRPVVGRYIKLDQISSGFNGSETSFSMTAGSQAVFPGTARNLLLSLGGVIQEPDTNFTISGSTLTFTTAPVANTTFFAVIFGDMQSTGTPSDGTVLPASIASSGNFSFPQLTVTGTSSLGDDVTFTGANYNATWDKSADSLIFNDQAAIKLGTGGDFTMLHTGTGTFLSQTAGSGHLYIRQYGTSDSIFFNGANSETFAKFTHNGNCELYFDNSKKLETTSGGVLATGDFDSTTGIFERTTGFTSQLIFTDSNETKLVHGSNGQVKLSFVGVANAARGSIDGQSGFIRIKTATDDTGVICRDNSSTDLRFDDSTKFETTSAGGTLTGDFTVTGNIYGGNHITIQDSDGASDMLKIGASEDLRIYHYNNNSYIRQHTDLPLIIGGTSTGQSLYLQPKDGENSAIFKPNGAVELYHNNVLRLETRTNDVKFYDGLVAIDNAQIQLGNSGDLKIYHDGTNSYIDNVITGILRIRGNTSGQIELQPKGGEYGLITKPNDATELYYDHVKKFATTSTGVKVEDGQVHIDSASSTTNDLDMLVLDGGATGFNGSNDADTQYGIQFKGCSFATGGIGIVQRIGGQIIFRKDGTWNASAGGGGQCKTTIAFTNSTGTFDSSPSTLAQKDMLLIKNDQIDVLDRLDVIHNGSTNYVAEFKNTNTSTPYGLFANSPSSASPGYPIFSVSQAGVTPSTKFRVDSHTGRIYINTDSMAAVSGGSAEGKFIDSNDGARLFSSRASTNAREHLIFYNPNGDVGDITTSSSSTTFNTSSDYRLKENEVLISDGITRLKTLKPYKFNWKKDPSTIVDGFFAHEVTTAVPEAVTGVKDGTESCSNVVLDKDSKFLEKDVTEDQWNAGKAQEPAIYPADSTWEASYTKNVYQKIDHSKLVPLLTAALQEEISKREALEARVAALEAA